MNEKLNRLSTRISQLEDRKIDLEDELDEVNDELLSLQEELERIEMASIDLSDNVDVHVLTRGKLDIVAHPAKIVGNLAIIRRDNNWQICSVFKGRKVRYCQTLEIALELIEKLQQFNWDFAQEENPVAPKEIIDFMSAWENRSEAIAL